MDSSFLDSIVGSIEQKEINLFKSIIETSEITNFKYHEEFFYGVLYSFDQFIIREYELFKVTAGA